MQTPYKPFIKNKIKDLAHLTERGQNVTHGDVIIVRCDESDVPADFDQWPVAKNLVLAEGEHSGHAHALFQDNDDSDIYVPPAKPSFSVIEGGKGVEPTGTFVVRQKGEEMFLKIEGAPMLLRHQEHTPFRLYPGTYEIGIQEETWDELRRKIAD